MIWIRLPIQKGHPPKKGIYFIKIAEYLPTQ